MAKQRKQVLRCFQRVEESLAASRARSAFDGGRSLFLLPGRGGNPRRRPPQTHFRLHGRCPTENCEEPLFLAGVKQGMGDGLGPDDVVVMDHLATHKVAGGWEAIEGVGARLEYLPPYSPDFNPIESLGARSSRG